MALIAVFALATAALASTASAQPLDFLGSPCTGSVCDNGMECLSLSGGECDWDGWSADTACSCGGMGGENDPYFTGFTGQSFYLSAEAGNTYNLFSEQTHLVNAYFVATELPEKSDLLSIVSDTQNSSFIGAVALVHNDTTVEILSDRAGEVSVKINGKEVDFGLAGGDFDATLQLPSNVTLALDKHPYLYTNTLVTVDTELLTVTAFPESAHRDNMGSLVRGHLSLQMSLKASADSPPCAHGVLGQTVRSDVTSSIQDEFPGEGQASNYIVSSLNASDFAYNLYGQPRNASLCPQPAQQQMPRVSLSRKLLTGNRSVSNARLEASFGGQALLHFRQRQLAEGPL